MSFTTLQGTPLHGWRMMLSDPTGQIERECADPFFKQKDVALTYAMAIRDENSVSVDWHRVNAAIRNRWPKGLDRVKQMAWAKLRSPQATPTTNEAKEK